MLVGLIDAANYQLNGTHGIVCLDVLIPSSITPPDQVIVVIVFLDNKSILSKFLLVEEDGYSLIHNKYCQIQNWMVVW